MPESLGTLLTYGFYAAAGIGFSVLAYDRIVKMLAHKRNEDNGTGLHHRLAKLEEKIDKYHRHVTRKDAEQDSRLAVLESQVTDLRSKRGA